MRVRLNLIGSCSVTLVDEKGESPLATSSRLLYHLAVATPDGLYRNELAQELWPLDEPAACRNRLRVALSKLRAKAPDAVIESKNRLLLNHQIVSIDHLMVREEAALVEDEVAPLRELEGWVRLSGALAGRFAPTLEAQSFEAPRAEWSEWAGERLRRGADLALGLGRFDSSRDLALAGLSHLSDDRALWNVLLSACRALGDLQPARRLYARLKSEAKQSGTDFAGESLGLAKDLRDAGGPNESECSTEGRRFSDALLREGLEKRPDLVLPLLAAPQLLPLVGGNPRQAADLLEEAVSKSPVDLPEWPRCAARLIGLWAWLDESQKVQDLSPQVLASTEDPLIKRAVFNALAASLALKGRWTEAEQTLDQTKLLAEESGSRLDAINVDGNRACYWWMQGRFDEADELYDQVLVELKTLDDERGKFDEAVALGNRAFIPVMQGHFDEGRRRLQEAASWRDTAGIDLPDGLEGPCLSMLKIREGELAGAARQMRKALMSLFDGRSKRMQFAGLEYAALSLVWIRRADAAVLSMERIAEWRDSCGFELCEAERQLRDAALLEAGSVAPSSEDDLPDLSGPEELGAWIVRAIRHAEVAQRDRNDAQSGI